jgi:hypothetical protein
MTLILQIAAGIVLGFLIVQNLPRILPLMRKAAIAGAVGVALVAAIVLAVLAWTAIRNHWNDLGFVLAVGAGIVLLMALVQYSARGLGYLYVALRPKLRRSATWRGLLHLFQVHESWLMTNQPPKEIARVVGDQIFRGLFRFVVLYGLGWLTSYLMIFVPIAYLLRDSATPPSSETLATVAVIAAIVPALVIYVWARRRRESDAIVLVDVASTVFDQECAGDTPAARWYQAHPELKADARAHVQRQVWDAAAETKNPELTRRLRGKLAEALELFIHTAWYSQQRPEDRDVYARHMLNSTREVQDPVYQDGGACSFMVAAVLSSTVINGWDGTEDSKQHLRRLQTNYADECRAHCDLGLRLAWAREHGTPLSEEEKAQARSRWTLREVCRRALAGEKVFDEEPATASG